MPVYRTNTIFELARGVKCFLGLNFGVTRGRIPALDAWTENGKAESDRVRELQRQLEASRENLSRKDKRISRLEKQLSVIRGDIHEGVVLPPAHMRPNSKKRRQDNEAYLGSARHEVDWMVENLGLTLDSSVLDLGCGPGRIAIGILDRVGEIHKYRGVDVSERYIRWAQHHITFEHPNFQFRHLNLKNDHYNPRGEKIGADVSFPFASEEFDVICLFSVFTHMLTEDVRSYLKELRRVLHPSGKILLTANLEDGVPDVVENPKGYRGVQEYIMRLQTVRYNREFFEGLLDESGFQLERYDPDLRQGQRCLIISQKSEGLVG